ncbi:MoaD/ThiS family protein [bacterium]|jgi:molybdopterin converting factor small subunit|nr:MoaD/ThiS family protein [bacterium]
MATVIIPAVLRPVTGGVTKVDAAGSNVREVIDDLVRQYGGLRDRVIDENGVRPEVFIAVSGHEVFDLATAVAPDAEVNILPAIAGG